jgi:hypothetical protein
MPEHPEPHGLVVSEGAQVAIEAREDREPCGEFLLGRESPG